MGTSSSLSFSCLVKYKMIIIIRTLSIASSEKRDMVFATIFVVIWVGAGVVTLNAKLLGGKA